jgi:hypothetical protein
MPVSTSPYQQNDYNAASAFRPYQLPVNDIYKAIAAQDQFWDQGAARVKSVYDNALGLNLSIGANKQIRDNFMKDAEKQISKLSTMNLADPSVQRQGMGIFKPLFQDEGILYDDAMTKHYEKVRNDALRYRQQDDGKGYSDTNLAYAMDGYNDFVNSTDRMAGKKFYEKRKEYTPFYDPTSELNGILKNCKPDKATNDVVQGYYINTYSDESLSAAKINACMDAGLSERAKRQLQINGYVQYKNNPEALASQYLPYLQGTRTQLSEEKAAIQGVLANKDNLKSLSKKQLAKLGLYDSSQITPEFIKSLEEQQQSIDDRILNTSETIKKLLSNDFSPIMGDNLETVAGTIYTKDYIKNIGEGFSYDFRTNEKKADPVQMMFYREHMANLRQEDQQKFEMDKLEKELDANLKLKLLGKGNFKSLLGMNSDLIDGARQMNDTTSPFTQIQSGDAYDDVTKKRQEIAQQRTDLNQWFVKRLQGFGMPKDITSGSPEEKQWIANFRATATDPIKIQTLQEYDSKMDKLVSLEDLHRHTQEIVDERVKPLEKNFIHDISKMPSVNVKVGNHTVTVSAIDIYNSIMGKQSPLKINNGSLGSTIGTPYGSTSSSGYEQSSYSINGVPINTTASAFGVNPLHKLVRDIQKMKSDYFENVKNTRNNYMKEETVLQKEGYNFAFLNSNDKDNEFKAKIAGELGIPLDHMQDITIGQTDFKGDLIVRLNHRKNVENDYDFEGALKKLKSYGGQDNITLKDDPYGVMLRGLDDFKVIDENNLASIMKPYMRALEKRTTPNRNQSTGFLRASSGTAYRLEVSKGSDGGFVYDIIDQEKPNSPVYSTPDRDDALGMLQTRLGNTSTIGK